MRLVEIKHGKVRQTPRCSLRRSSHTIWYYVEDGGPPTPCEVRLDTHADAMEWIEGVLGGPAPPQASLRWLKVFRTHNEAYECFHWENDAPWPPPIPPHHHMAVDIYTRRWRDRFRKRYWVRCFECDLNEGPFLTVAESKAALLAANEMAAP